MSETLLERAPSFFASPERCRQNYLEAWNIGREVFLDRIKMIADLEKAKESIVIKNQALKGACICDPKLQGAPEMKNYCVFCRARLA